MDEKLDHINQIIIDFISEILNNVIVDFIVTYQYGIIIFSLLVIILILLASLKRKRKLNSIITSYNESINSPESIDTDNGYIDKGYKDTKCKNYTPIDNTKIEEIRRGIFLLSSNIDLEKDQSILNSYLLVVIANLTYLKQPIKINLYITKQDEKVYEIEVTSAQFKIEPNKKPFIGKFCSSIDMCVLGIGEYKMQLYINNKGFLIKKFNITHEAEPQTESE